MFIIKIDVAGFASNMVLMQGSYFGGFFTRALGERMWISVGFVSRHFLEEIISVEFDYVGMGGSYFETFVFVGVIPDIKLSDLVHAGVFTVSITLIALVHDLKGVGVAAEELIVKYYSVSATYVYADPASSGFESISVDLITAASPGPVEFIAMCINSTGSEVGIITLIVSEDVT